MVIDPNNIKQTTLAFDLQIADSIVRRAKYGDGAQNKGFLIDLEKTSLEKATNFYYKEIKKIPQNKFEEAREIELPNMIKDGIELHEHHTGKRPDDREIDFIKNLSQASIPKDKQNFLNKISQDALEAGVSFNPNKGEKVTISSIKARMQGALATLVNGAKEALGISTNSSSLSR